MDAGSKGKGLINEESKSWILGETFKILGVSILHKEKEKEKTL